MKRFATLDVGTNSVLLLVAEKGADGHLKAICEEATLTRLGKDVDRTGRFHPQALQDTLEAVEGFVARARQLGAHDIAISATSAARDAGNGAEFLDGVFRRCGVQPEILSGDEEAELSYLAAAADFAGPGAPLVVIDIGGGSTEFIYGNPAAGPTAMGWHRSFDVGSVRLSERFSKEGEFPQEGIVQMRETLRATFSALPPPPHPCRVVGVAGTVTSLLAVEKAIVPYDAAQVHGQVLSLAQVRALAERLGQLPVRERQRLPGLHPKRADVLPAGAWILATALEALQVDRCTVSDRGLRWGLLRKRFGA